jgi:hypothetical protein
MLNESQKKVLYHLGYEWWMFRTTHFLLTLLPASDDPGDPVRNDPVRNALVESLAVHGRGLVYFFYFKKREDTDWNVTDLGIALEEEPTKLKDWRQDTNKRVVHLTDKRANPLQAWRVAEAQCFLQAKIEEVRQALGQDIPDDWIGDHTASTQLLVLRPPSGNRESVGPTGPAR